jgi:hypothetical protein
MQLQRRDVTNLRSGILQSQKFSVEMNGVLFRTAIDGIYADKQRAPLRELCTNAWDASPDHRFDVHLPSVIDPRVIVRDWGPGLSHDEAMGLYTTLFASTKRDSNDVAGCLGLGSKSPFAYGAQFFVRSFQQGQVRSYSASIEADGVPCLVHMSTKSTTEPDGLEVSFNVKTGDIEAFRKAARFTLFGFEPRPNVLNECWEWPDLTLVAQGRDWRVHYPDRERTFLGPYAKMGPILYPIDVNALGLTYHENWIKEDVLILDLPIGSVDIAVSRESLGYDYRTIAFLKQRLGEAREEIKSYFLAEVDRLDHVIAAALFIARHRYKLLDRVCGGVRQWRGQDLPWGLDVKGFSADVINKFRRKRWGNVPVKSLNFAGKHQIEFELFAKPIPVFIDVNDEKTAQRILAADWGGQEKGIWIKTLDPPTTLAHMGNPPNVIFISDLPLPAKPPRAARAYRSGATIEVLNEFGRETQHFDYTLGGGWFVGMEGRTPKIGNRRFESSDDVKVLFSLFDQTGIPIDRIHAISKTKQKRRIFRNLKQLTSDVIREFLGAIDFAQAKRHEMLLQGNQGLARTLENTHPELKLPPDLQQVWNTLKNPGDSHDYEKYQLLQFLGLTTADEENTSFAPVMDLDEALKERFPLLQHIALHHAETAALQLYIDLVAASAD